MPRKILLVFAHPSDESFACGGTIAEYTKYGWEIELICATRGEAGESGSGGNSKDENLGKVRQLELESAAQILGITKITFLDYQDSKLAQLPPGELEDKLFKIFREAIPDYVITFDTSGISNHLDHIKLCYVTTFVFQKYAAWVKERLPQDEEENKFLPKLYYASAPESAVKFLRKIKALPIASFGSPWRGIPDRLITTVIDIKDTQAKKIEALKCHQSQEEDIKRFLQSPLMNPFLKHEYFILRMQGTTEVFMGKNDQINDYL